MKSFPNQAMIYKKLEKKTGTIHIRLLMKIQFICQDLDIHCLVRAYRGSLQCTYFDLFYEYIFINCIMITLAA